MKLIRTLKHSLLILGLGSLILLALYTSLGRYYLPLLNEHRVFLLTQLSQASGLDIQAANLDGRWQKLYPILYLREVRIAPPGSRPQDGVQVAQARIVIDPLASLFDGALRLRSLSLHGLDLTLAQQADGHWGVAGFAPGKGYDLDNLKRLLRSLRALEITHTQVRLRNQRQQWLELSELTVVLQAQDDFRRLQLRSRLLAPEEAREPLLPLIRLTTTPAQDAMISPENTLLVMLGQSLTELGVKAQPPGFPTGMGAGSVYLVAESDGDPLVPELFSAKAYLRGERVPVAALTNLLSAQDRLAQLSVNGEAWLRWAPGQGFTSQGQFDSPLIQGSEGATPWQLGPVSVSYRLEQGTEGWQAWLAPFSVGHEGHMYRFGPLHLQAQGQSPEVLDVATPALDLGVAHVLLSAFDPLPQKAADTLAILRPRGVARDLRVHIPLARDNRSAFALAAELDEVDLEPWVGAPGVRNLGGSLRLGVKGGELALNARDLQLSLPRVYRDPLQLAEARGLLTWSRYQGRIQVRTEQITAKAAFGHAAVGLDLDIAEQPGGDESSMLLLVGLREADAAARGALIPYTLDAHLQDWLARSIQGGRVEQGAFLYRTSLVKGSNESPTLQLWLDIAEGDLDYAPPLPVLRHLRGQFYLEDRLIRGEVYSGQVYDSAVNYAGIEVLRDDRGNKPEFTLQVEGEVAATAGDGVRLLQKSPLRQRVGDFVDQWQASGSGLTRLDLKVPLSRGAPPLEIHAETHLENVTLRLQAQRLEFTQIQGDVSYSTAAGLRFVDVTGRLWGVPVTASTPNAPGQPLVIAAEGQVAAEALGRWLNSPLFGLMSGTAPVSARLEVAGADSVLRLQSSLRGVAVDVPAPLGKSADSERPLAIDVPLGPGAGPWRLRYSPGVEGVLGFSGGRLQQGSFTVGNGRALPLQENRMRLTGQLDSVDLGAWQAVLKHYRTLGQPEGANPSPWLLQVENLQVAQLKAFGRTLENVSTGLEQRSDRWRVQLDNPDLRGYVDVFRDERPIHAHLERLQVASFRTPADIEGPPASLDPRSLRAMKIDIDQLYNNAEDFGDWHLEIVPVAGGVELRHVQAKMRGVEIDGADDGAYISWLMQGEDVISHFQGSVRATNLARVLASWGYEQFIESSRGRMTADMTWIGSPMDFDLRAWSGQADFSISKGSFRNVSNTTSGALKVVGFLNIDRLVRRLSLDFSDLTSDGMSFERIRGHIDSRGGQWRFSPAVEVVGASSNIKLSGDVDLENKALDMDMALTVPMGSNLTWVAALTGGLPAAAGVYLVSKLLKEEVDKFSSAVYSLKGDWNEPEIQFERLFNAEAPEEMDRPEPQPEYTLPNS